MSLSEKIQEILDNINFDRIHYYAGSYRESYNPEKDIENLLSLSKQFEADKAELQKALIDDINADCYKYCLQFNSKYECNTNDCGFCKERIQLLEKQMGKSWAEIKGGK